MRDVTLVIETAKRLCGTSRDESTVVIQVGDLLALIEAAESYEADLTEQDALIERLKDRLAKYEGLPLDL